MPFDSNGTFNRVRSWVSDAAASIKIRADYHDTHDGDLASGLSQCITKDGRTQPTANIPMNGKKIINHGDTLAGDAPSTVATKSYVDNFKTFATGMTITGANYPNGMISFGATTGVTGISWANANMAWVGKVAETDKWRQRLCVTDDAQGVGNEIITIDKQGILGNISGWYTHNLSHDGTAWRTNATGFGSAMLYTNGTMLLYSNDTATLQNNQTTTLQPFWTFSKTIMTHSSNGSCVWNMQKRDPAAAGSGGAGPFTNSIRGMVAGELRWNLELGNGTAETGSAYVGSNYVLTAYDNNGAGAKTMYSIDRSTNRHTLYGDVYSSVGVFHSSTTTAIFAAANGGAVYLRPNGSASATEQCYVSNVGDWHIAGGNLYVDANTTKGAYLGMGQRSRNGVTGGYGGNWHNWLWASSYVYALVDSTNVGAIQMVCDYRTKRNVEELPPTWEAVKKLHPIKYQYKAWPGITGDEDDDEIRWGFVAHELQGTLTKSAATFDKDADNALQSPNLMVVVAALTKALQEAMQRIEALEAGHVMVDPFAGQRS